MSLKRPHDKTSSEVNKTTVRSPKRVKQKTKAPSVSERALTHPTLASSIPGRSATASTFISSNQILIDDPLHASVEPVVNFRDLPTINKHADALISSFDTPTPIQAATWPYLFNRRSCIGIAETGSGKTLAFGVPCIDFVQAKNKKHKRSRISALVISPTRELALQVHEELQKLTGEGGPRVVCAYGGVPKDTQREALRKAHIVVATPGRLNDFIQEGSAKLDAVQYLVLDEADRMLDQGFADEIRKIVSATAQSRRQTLMFTATWPSGVRELAATYMENAVKITIGGDGTGDLRANQRIKQTVEVIRPEDKQTRLVELLRHATKGAHNVSDRLLVFCLYKKEAARIETFICAKGFAAAGIHGDMSQSQRTTNLDNFKSGKVPILVATDVAARGLDIPSVKLVINFTFPLTVEDYVHRIGRTGRAGKSGSSVTLFTEHDKALSGSLINILKGANQSVPEELLKFGATVKKKSHSIYGDFFKDVSSETQQATKILFD